LETVLTTLIENAGRAGGNNVAITASIVGPQACLTLTDNGPGIPAGDVGRIFEPFFTNKRAEGGTGLGLPIARALIEGNGGRRLFCPACFEIMRPC
jgi:signal transduction histidine kinase